MPLPQNGGQFITTVRPDVDELRAALPIIRPDWPAPSDPVPDLPLTPDGTVATGVLYQDSIDAGTTWYLPSYTNQTVDGLFTTTLKWRGPEDDVNGPIAHLTVRLAAMAPSSATTGSVEIPHDPIVRLTYNLPVGQVTPDNADATAPASLARTVTAIEIGALAAGPDGSRSARLDITEKADFDALYRAMTDETVGGQLQIVCSATMGLRIFPRQWDPTSFDRVLLTPTTWAQPTTWPPRQELLMTAVTTRPVTTDAAAARVTVDRSALIANRFADTTPAQMKAFQPDALRMPGRGGPEWPPEVPERPPVRPPVRPVQPPVQTFPPLIPIRLHPPVAGAPIRPVQATVVQTVSFCFPIASNAYMFDIPGELTPTTNEILLPMVVDIAGEGSTTYYQDSLYPDRFYYRPQQFRLSRPATPPYLPSVQFEFVAATDSSGAGTTTDFSAEVAYQVRMSYKASPWISPIVLETIAQQAAASDLPNVTILPLVPQSSRLSLILSLDSADPPGTAVAVPRPAASITFDSGIFDQILLSPDEFTRLVAALRTTGVDGAVDAVLIGSTTTDVPVSLALDSTVGPAFSSTLAAGTEPGAWQVTLTNRWESPIQITGLFTTVIGPGVTALPGPAPAAPIPPDGSATISYQVTPADADVLAIGPAMEFTVEIDPAAMLPLLMVNAGYTTQTFPLDLGIDSQYFTAPATDGRMLVGITVSFDSGAEVHLTPAALTATVSLRYPLLPWLLNSADAQRYSYTLTSSWNDGTGGTPSAPQQVSGNTRLIVVPGQG